MSAGSSNGYRHIPPAAAAAAAAPAGQTLEDLLRGLGVQRRGQLTGVAQTVVEVVERREAENAKLGAPVAESAATA